MLNGLDNVDWASLEGPYGPATKVPQMLRAAANAPDMEQFGAAYGDFLNEANHQGTIYQVTPYTVPFLLELLAQETSLERLEAYLYTLVEFIKATRSERYPLHTGRSYPPTRDRYDIALHDAVCDGLDLYLALLSHSELKLRGLAMYLLTFLAGHHERVGSPLQDFAMVEINSWVRAGTLWGISRLWRDAGDGSEHPERAEWFKGFIKNASDPLVRAISALAYVQSGPWFREWPAFVVETLANSLTHPPDQGGDAPNDFYFHEEDFLPFEGDWICEIGCAALLPHNMPLIQLVNQCKAQPHVMHRLIRELLDASFGRATFALWGAPDPVFQKSENAIIYRPPTGASHYVPGNKLPEYQARALRAIIDCDAFWALPTNLLSFFYGLPDERDALRELLA